MCSVWYLERGQVWTYHLSKLSFPRILFVVASAPFSCRSSWPTCGVFSARGSRAVLFVQTRTSRTLWSDVFLAICARKSTSAPENQDVTAMSRCKASVLFLIAPMSFTPPPPPLPPPMREHRASIGKGEMSFTMCGCFQLTSEACYEYSDVAHCAHRCSPEKQKTDAIASPHSTWMYCPEP